MVSSVGISAQTEPEPLRLISYNVWYGFTKKPERKEAWLKWMSAQKPDIVALQELNKYTPDQLKEDAATWGHEHSVLLKENGFPTGLTSRFPITDIQRIREGFHHGLLRARTSGLIFYVVHFHPSNWEFRIREARLLLADVAKLSPADQKKVVLIGDFNGFSPNEKAHLEKDGELAAFFTKLDADDRSKNLNNGKLDYAGIQAFHDADYADLIHLHLKPNSPYPGTFPTKARPGEDMGRDRRLDYIFVPKDLVKRIRSAQVVRDPTTDMLSDHYPLIIDLKP